MKFLNKSKKESPYKDFLDLISLEIGGFEGKKVFEAGCDVNGALIKTIVTDYSAQESVGINLVSPNKQILDNCYIKNGDLRNIDLPDNYFDIIVSSSVFEHVKDLDIALEEMFRILKPGGYLYSHFGPIWSTSYGHHLWFDYEQKTYTYHNVILPPYCHLLMTKNEVLDFCKEKYDEKLSEKIVEYVFESPEQNQLFFEDYEKIIKESKFKTLFFKGYDYAYLANKYITRDFPNYSEKLVEKFSENRKFMYDGITLLLKKD